MRTARAGRPVVFIHGLWLLPSSWDRWATVFEEAGFTPLTPGWPDDPETVEEANANPDVFAHKTVGGVADHFAEVIGKLGKKPAVIGHSFGGLLTQIIAGRGLSPSLRRDRPRAVPRRAAAAGLVAQVIPPGARESRESQPRGSAHLRAVPLRLRQRGLGGRGEGAVRRVRRSPPPGAPLFQAATANLNPWTEAKVNSKNPERGPLLIISGEKDHTVPWAIANASFKKQKRNKSTTEIVEIKNRGHALTIDSGWREVADTALAFVKRFA